MCARTVRQVHQHHAVHFLTVFVENYQVGETVVAAVLAYFLQLRKPNKINVHISWKSANCMLHMMALKQETQWC